MMNITTSVRHWRWFWLAIGGAGLCGTWVTSGVALEMKSKAVKFRVDVLFSPDGGCSNRIIREIGRAQKSIRMQMYLFTSKPIGQALIEAKKRGVDVRVILDKSQEKMTYGRFRVLRRGGVDVYFDGEHATANNKILLIDHRTIITGSYNYTKAAEEKNAENILIIKGDSRLFDKYLTYFDQHLAHSKK